MKRKLWDKRPDEKPDDYLLFLNFRNCGPQRSLRKAVKEFSKQFPNSQFVTKNGAELATSKLSNVMVPSKWQHLYRKFNWEARATAYDISTMRLIGSQLVILQGRALKILARRTISAAKKCNLDKSKDVVETMKLIQSYINPVVENVLASQGDDTAEYEEIVEDAV